MVSSKNWTGSSSLSRQLHMTSYDVAPMSVSYGSVITWRTHERRWFRARIRSCTRRCDMWLYCAMLVSGPRNKSHSFVRGRAISSRKWRGERSLSIGILGFGEEPVDWELGEEVIVCLFCSWRPGRFVGIRAWRDGPWGSSEGHQGARGGRAHRLLDLPWGGEERRGSVYRQAAMWARVPSRSVVLLDSRWLDFSLLVSINRAGDLCKLMERSLLFRCEN